jgi:putative ABC transport system permease protein
MSWMRVFGSRLLGFFWRRSAEENLDAEMRAHLDALTEEHIRRGMDSEEARCAARREFGGVEQTKQTWREQRGLPFLETLWQDVRFSLRLMGKNAALSTVIVAILAVGIGAGTSLYSLIDACLIRTTITHAVADRWEVVRAYLPSQKTFVNFLSAPEILEVKQLRELFEAVGAVHGDSFTLTRGEYPERILGTRVTANTITMTQTAPILGRTFREDEDRPGGPRVVVLSYELWQRRFSGDRNVLGSAIRLDDLDYTVIGVMPHYYDLWGGELWIPLQLDFANNNRSDRRNWIVAVLRKGVSEAQANARLRTLSKQLEQQYGITSPEYRDWDLSVWNIKEAVIGGVKPALLVLAGAVGLLILIVCANVAVLLLVRATSRMKEIALRVALGARRARIIRQMLTESLLLSFAGAVGGVCISAGCLPLLVHLIPRQYLPTAPELVRVDHSAIAVACGIAVFTGILFGIAPALQISKQDFVESLKESGSKIGGSRFGRLVRNALIVAEIALSLVVLAGAALMAQSYRHLEGIDLGFRADHLLSFRVSLPETKYPRGEQIAQFFERALQEMGSAAMVESVAAVSGQPMGDRVVDLASRDFTIEGRPSEDARAAANACFRVVSPDYFRTMGARILQGRNFSERDGREAPRVTVINQTMAHVFWPSGDAVGHRIYLGRQYGRPDVFAGAEADERPLTIVGVVSDVRQTRVIDAPVRQEFYVALAQQANPPRIMTLLARSTIDPAMLTNSARMAVRSADAEQPIYDVNPMDQVVADSFGPKRLTLFLLVFLSAVALILACTGLFATLSYSVSQRHRELGIRVAVGAKPRDILRLVVFEGAHLAIGGVTLGLLAAFAITRLMKTLLYEVNASDPLTLFGTAAILVTVAVLASYVPARRATQVDPTTVLRSE